MSDLPQSAFQTTHWTAVIAAKGDSPEGKRALRALCESYYAPVAAFIERYRHGNEDARDLTHAFFAKLLEGESLNTVDRTRGRFRSYLLGAAKHFLADLRERGRTLKRGGGRIAVSFDSVEPQGESPGTPNNQSGSPTAQEPADPQGFPADAYFDREWALAVLSRSLDRLQAEAVEAGRGEQMEVLRPWLTGEAAAPLSGTIADRLGVTEGSLKVIIHRFRKRFRELVREELAATVDSPHEIDAELDYLIRALSFGGK